MGDIVFIDVAQKRRDDRLQDLWNAFNSAREKAQAPTGTFNDGVAAGKAWAAWLDAWRAVYA